MIIRLSTSFVPSIHGIPAVTPKLKSASTKQRSCCHCSRQFPNNRICVQTLRESIWTNIYAVWLSFRGIYPLEVHYSNFYPSKRVVKAVKFRNQNLGSGVSLSTWRSYVSNFWKFLFTKNNISTARSCKMWLLSFLGHWNVTCELTVVPTYYSAIRKCVTFT